MIRTGGVGGATARLFSAIPLILHPGGGSHSFNSFFNRPTAVLRNELDAGYLQSGAILALVQQFEFSLHPLGLCGLAPPLHQCDVQDPPWPLLRLLSPPLLPHLGILQ